LAISKSTILIGNIQNPILIGNIKSLVLISNIKKPSVEGSFCT